MSRKRDTVMALKLRMAANVLAEVHGELHTFDERLDVARKVDALMVAARKAARCLETGEPYVDPL